jgi:hypothetical protein
MHAFQKEKEINGNEIDSSHESNQQTLNKRLKLDVIAFIKKRRDKIINS